MRQARKHQSYRDGGYSPDLANPGKNRKVVDLRRAARLREARIAAGFTLAVDASRAFGWSASTYWSHENGSRGISRDRIMVYARAFRVRPDWLGFGEGTAGAGDIVERRITIEGYMTSEAKIVATAQEDKPTIIVPAEIPPGLPGDWVGYRVDGDGNYPAFRDGDTILVQRRQGAPVDYLNRECLVTMPTGERLVRTILRGSRAGLFVLVGFNNPPLIDVDVAAAAPIEWIKRG
jgi:transcriptional regulator with XRE-family HTH domain